MDVENIQEQKIDFTMVSLVPALNIRPGQPITLCCSMCGVRLMQLSQYVRYSDVDDFYTLCSLCCH